MSSAWPQTLQRGQIRPFFQPIIGVETQTVAAFEALGRLETDGQVQSLGPFFHDAEVGSAYVDLRTAVDRAVRLAALQTFAREGRAGQRLFLNVRPSQMAAHLASGDPGLPWTLRTAADLGVDPRSLVIELTEEALGSATPTLRRLIDLYREHGCAIAVDDVGAEASNLDRIGYFEPDIIKIDALMLRRSLLDRSFRQVLRGVSTMAEGLGASLLFEGVETEQDFDQALSFGARYAQGWYFSEALPGFLAVDAFASRVRPRLQAFGTRLAVEAGQVKARLRQVTEGLGDPPRPVAGPDQVWGFGPGALDPWTPLACRVFLTDEEGFQVSPNFERERGAWVPRLRGFGLCRSVRPYFPSGGDKRWSVSEPYFDVNDRVLVRTYSRPVDPGLLLFVDVPEVETPGPTR